MGPTTPRVAGGAAAAPAADPQHRYDAFISYRHVEPDRRWAQWLHSALETYRVPKRLAAERGLPRRVGRVFRDEEELPASSDLNNEIERALEQSRYLVVVCSPRTPESRWVNREVERFREMGRHDRILALLVKGEPAESFPRAMVEIRHSVVDAEGRAGERIEEVEPLAADVRETRNESQRYLKRMARLRILSILLGVRFDDLRQREQERRTRRLAYLGGLLGVLLVIVGGLAVFAFRQRAIAVRQRGIAVQQRQLADEQRQAADEQRRRAELELAQNTVLQGDMLGAADRWPEAKARYGDADGMLVKLGAPPLAARLGLWDAARHAPPPLDVLGGHTDAVWCAAVSPDGKWLLSGGRDNTLRLWDLATGRVEKTLEAAGETVAAVAFLPDGTHALSAGDDKAVKVWNLADGTVERALTGHEGPVAALRVAPDGRSVYSAGRDGTVRRWDLESGQVLHTFPLGDAVYSLDVSPDGSQLLCGTSGGKVKLFDTAGGEERRTIAAHDILVGGVAFLPPQPVPQQKGRPGTTNPATQATRPAAPTHAVSASYDRRLKVWDLSTGKAVQTIDNVTAGLSALTVTPDGRALAAGWDGTLKLWDLSTGKAVYTFTGHGLMVRGAAVTPDGRVGVSACDDKTLRLWNLTGGRGVRTFTTPTANNVAGIGLPPDKQRILVASMDGLLWTLDRATGNVLRSDGRFRNVGLVAAFAPDGSRAIFGGLGGAVTLWDLSYPAGSAAPPPAPLGTHAAMVNCAAFSPDGRLALTGDTNGVVKLWDVAVRKELRTVSHNGQVNGVGFSPDGRMASSVSADALKLWDTAGGNVSRTITPPELSPAAALTAAAFSADGATVLVGTAGGRLRLYDAATAREVRTFAGAHVQRVAAVAFSQDGRLAASASDDGTSRLWDVASGRELRVLVGHTDKVTSVAFDAGGEALLTGSTDGTARLWDFTNPAAVRAADEKLAAARAALARNPRDGAALAAAGEARAAQGLDAWAADCLERARAAGGDVSALTMARCRWRLGDRRGAAAEFRRALERKEAPEGYLRACLAAVERERG